MADRQKSQQNKLLDIRSSRSGPCIRSLLERARPKNESDGLRNKIKNLINYLNQNRVN